MGQVTSYVAQNETGNRDEDRGVCHKYKSMLESIFGWSEASKCKKLIKKTRSRLNQHRNNRFCFVKHLKDDTEKLIKLGEFERAFQKIDEVYKEECFVAVYDLLAQFCERIFFHLSHIRRNKTCPKDVMEAISSVIFASARCGNLPELLDIRRLFSTRYGEHLETEAVNLLPGNHVDIQIIEKLSINKVSDEEKYKLLKKISEKVEQAAPLVDEFISKQIDNDSESTSSASSSKDIQEFKSPLNKGSDQRGFRFISSPQQNDIDMENFQISTRRCSVSSANTEKNMPLSGHEKTMERGMSLPCERATTPLHEIMLEKSYSLPPSSPHVHPKLPDYDVIQATFTDLKKQNLLNRKSLSTPD